MKREYQICNRCIMDTTDPEIIFDDNGICCHCKNYEKRAQKELYVKNDGKKRLEQILKKVKENGKNREYDCIIGLSGGVDSSMVAYYVRKFGLRTLAIHLDNGWNTELSVCNIEKLVKKLDIDLLTYVLDWEEFKDLHRAFLLSSVTNSEVPTDHAIVAILIKMAAEKGIRYIFSGSNIVSEAIMPSSWGYDSQDWKHIKGIHKRFGSVKLKTFPKLNLFEWAYFTFIKQVKFIPILNYLDFNKKEAIELLENELGWKNYGGKHFESIYTRFFQAYILPKKYNIDKRRAHLSTLICSGQLNREAALEEMKKDPYPQDILKDDYDFFVKKLGFTKKEFEELMKKQPISFSEYPNNVFLYKKLNFVVKYAKKLATNN